MEMSVIIFQSYWSQSETIQLPLLVAELRASPLLLEHYLNINTLFTSKVMATWFISLMFSFFKPRASLEICWNLHKNLPLSLLLPQKWMCSFHSRLAQLTLLSSLPPPPTHTPATHTHALRNQRLIRVESTLSPQTLVLFLLPLPPPLYTPIGTQRWRSLTSAYCLACEQTCSRMPEWHFWNTSSALTFGRCFCCCYCCVVVAAVAVVILVSDNMCGLGLGATPANTDKYCALGFETDRKHSFNIASNWSWSGEQGVCRTATNAHCRELGVTSEHQPIWLMLQSIFTWRHLTSRPRLSALVKPLELWPYLFFI